MPRAHVTGASGFVGGHLVDRLRRGGWDVAAACRAPRRLGPGVEVVSMETECAPGAVVFHLAGRAHREAARGDNALYQADNCELAVQTYELAARGGASGFVFVSTARVLGNSSARPLEESSVPGAIGMYAQSKLAAEERLHARHERLGVPLAIVRPPLVYGPGVTANFLALMRWIRSGWPLPVGAATAPRSMVYVGNLVDALETIGRGVDGVHRWHVKDDEDLSVRALVERLATRMRAHPRVLRVPRGAVALAGKLARRPLLGSQLFDPFELDDQATRAALAWAPPVPVDEALEQTARWFETRS